MQPSSPVTMDRFRKVLIGVGFGLFLVFTYKAAQDVSNTAIAAGTRRIENMPAVAGYQPVMHSIVDSGTTSLPTQVSDNPSDSGNIGTAPDDKFNQKQSTKPLSTEVEEVTRQNLLQQKIKKPL